jgi:hypothetical protein
MLYDRSAVYKILLNKTSVLRVGYHYAYYNYFYHNSFIHRLREKQLDLMMTAPPRTPMRALSDHPAGDHLTSRSDVAEKPQGSNEVPVPIGTTCGDADNAIPVSPFEKRKCPSYYNLPKCVFPPRKEMALVEKFVAGTLDSEIETSPEKEAKRRIAYDRMTQTFRENADPDMIHKFLLALRTAGNGSTLHQLSGNPAKHVELLRVLHQLNPFQPNSPKKASDKNPDQPTKLIDSTLHLNFSISDAHFHLILALVSANPVFLVPSMVRTSTRTHLKRVLPNLTQD